MIGVNANCNNTALGVPEPWGYSPFAYIFLLWLLYKASIVWHMGTKPILFEIDDEVIVDICKRDGTSLGFFRIPGTIGDYVSIRVLGLTNLE